MTEDFKALVEKINANRAKSNIPRASSNSLPTSRKSRSDLNRGKYSDLLESEFELHADDIAAIEEKQDVCRGCKGRSCQQEVPGMVPVVAPENGRYYTAMRMCKWEKQRRENVKQARLFSRAKVPVAYNRDTFESYRVNEWNRAAVEAAKWSVGESRRGLFLYGPTGTGKTKLAAIIANEKTGRGQQVLFSSMPDFLADLRGSFAKKNTAEVMKAAMDVPCLILDDLGAERMTLWVGEQLFCLLNHRYNEGLQTIITSNYDPESIAARLVCRDDDGAEDDSQARRIMSRVFGMCEMVNLAGKDWRKGAVE